MAKKRKNGGVSERPTPTGMDSKSGSKLNIRTYEDVADSEDEFHINKDKILLDEGPAQKRQRRIQEEEDFLELSDEEVLAVPDAESDLEEDAYSDEIGADGDRTTRPGNRDEDVEDYSDADSREPEEDAGASGWGTSKKDYYNADPIETEADALEEEQEAIRIQQKQLQRMSEADFGFDEAEWLDSAKADHDLDSEQEGVVREVLPPLGITESMSPEEKKKILTTRYPELGPLSKEFLDLQSLHEQLRLDSMAAQALLDHRKYDTKKEIQKTPIATIKWTALSAYLAALSMYFAIFTSGPKNSNDQATAIPPTKLRDHSIMDSLVQFRNLWERVKDMIVPEPATKIPASKRGIDDAVKDSSKVGLAARNVESTDGGTIKKRKKKRKSKAERAAEQALAAAEAQRAERIHKTEEDLAKLFADTPRRSTAAPTTALQPEVAGEDGSDFGEETILSAHEAAEKARRKKSLQFYTSQLAQKANKRNTAGREAGGDADIPHRERFKDRQARLNAEAEGRGKKSKDASRDRLGGESDEEDQRVAKEVRGAVDHEDYYDLIAARTQKKKADKAARAAAERDALSRGASVRTVEEVGPDGKRAIGYTIEKNKGLTPRRKKEVRNPRVKKRMKFEEKKKKLGSIRQVYKGGEGRGGYGGELTGIKSNLVKSIKL